MEDKIEFEELYKAYELCLKNKKKKIGTYNFTNEELCMNLIQLLDILKNTPNIQNAENYLMICLYNNLGNTNITKITKKADTIKANEREYPAGSLDFLYANLDTLDDTI